LRGAREKEKRVEVLDEETYESVLEKLGINPVEVVVLRDGKPVPEDEKVVVSGKKGEVKIKVVRIVSGG